MTQLSSPLRKEQQEFASIASDGFASELLSAPLGAERRRSLSDR